jgi:nicotinate-nucleotide adenylyltransferase
MKVAFFGGTFDPVHLGHLVIARAAAEKFGLGLIYFVPADIPPHKQKRKLTDFQHRFAMLALATAEHKRFVPSLLDAPTGQPNYSVETVRRLKSTLGKSDKLYFLIGIDAFKDISLWHKPVELLGECEFIVASRPGYSLGDVGRALPNALRPSEASLRMLSQQHAGSIELPGATIHLLDEVRERVSSTQVRAAAHKSVKQLSRFVPLAVAEYIKKEHLYCMGAPRAGAGGAPHGKMLSLHRGITRSRKHE